MNASWPTRLRRRAGWDRNPLRRAEDRFQTAFTAALLLVFLTAGPYCFFVTAEHLYSSGVAEERHDRATLHRVEGPSTTGPTAHKQATPVLTGTRWIDDRGDPAYPPKEHISTIGESGFGGAAALAGVGLFLLGGRALVLTNLDRRRDRHWDEDWLSAETRWRRRA